MRPVTARAFSTPGLSLCGRFRVLDYFALCFAAMVFTVAAFFVYGGRAVGNAEAQVNVNGHDGNWFYPLDASETFIVSGPLGDTVVAINSGEAWIVSSPCLNQTCVASPPVRRRGQWIACLPNQVMLKVDGGADTGGPEADSLVDGVSW